jgi:CheY-like chemotaxis protein
VAYLTSGQHAGGCVGAMSYYTAFGEPPGQWAGKGAAALGLAGRVDPAVIGRLYQRNIGPGGELLVKRRQSKAADEREEATVAAYQAAHPYASAIEVAEVRAAERGKDPHSVPYFDMTVDAVKSVSVLHASYRISARQARERGEQDKAAALDARADEIEAALLDAAREAVAWLERHATYTRTGHHSARTGEWRDGDGLVASLFLHHISRDGDPHLHVHVALWNRVQRADQADEKWRTLDSRSLHNQRLAVAPVTDRIVETRLSALGYAMVPRLDGNGAEVGGVSQQVMDLFSSRSRALTPELKQMIQQYTEKHGKPPSKRTIWLLGQQAAQNTRRTKSEARRTIAGQTGAAEPSDAQRLAAWEVQTVREEVQALSAVHEQAEQFTRRAIPVLDESAKARAARIAVAEVQKHHATWTMAQIGFEVHRALPVMTPDADVEALITEVAKLAISGRAGAEVVQVTAPDVTDVTSLGVRQSDGGSIYRPPHEERWTTLPHLDVEDKILADAQTAAPQLISETQARAAVERTTLNPEQREAVVKMLTADAMATALVAPAGAGKSHTVSEFARLWTMFTRRRIIGLSTSTNAARVLQQELENAGAELAESYNIAEFLGKVEGSHELRRPVPLHENDVLVLDEATQASTADLAMIQETAKQAGARLNLVGDTEQLGSPEAGGMFQLLAHEVPAAELHEVRRFDTQWEADASVRLRSGDFAAIAAYDTRGRIRGADEEAAYQRAASAWLADYLQGKDVLLLAGSNAEAAELARRVQSKLAELGQVGQGKAALSDGNHAGVGDLVRARLNTEIDAGGQRLANRDTLKVTSIRGSEVTVRRQRQDATWTGPFKVPRSYLESSAELAYAGNVHVAQGRTMDTAHLLVTDTLSRRSLYVGMTRGRQSNTAHVVTGNTAPEGSQPYEQATPESVIKSIMQRESDDLSAIEQIRQSQEWVGGTGHLLNLWSSAVRSCLIPEVDEKIRARLSESEASQYQREPSRPVLQHKLRQYQLAGHDLSQLIDRITTAPLAGARSISSVLHGRLEAIKLDSHAHDVTWAQRTPESAPDVAHEVADGLDARLRELGERAIAEPQPWLLKHLGVLNPSASPALREEYSRRAGIAAGYREAAGIIDPEQAISPSPHSASPELDAMRQATIGALEITENPYRAMTCGQLEAKVAEGDRAQTLAPPDVSGQLRLTAQAEADAWQQSADAEVRHDQAEAASAKALAGQLGAEKARLEAIHADYERWSGKTRKARAVAGKAEAELQRRGMQPQEPEQSLAEWNQQFENDLAAVDRAITREHQAALDAGQPWPPEQKTPEPSEPEPHEEPASDVGRPGNRAARLDELQARADKAAQRIATDEAEQQASAEYVARIERQAQAEPQPDWSAERDEAEMEL